VGLLDRIRDCRRHDPRRYLPLRIDGVRYGSILPEAAEALREFPAVFEVGSGGAELARGLGGYEERTRAVAGVIPVLRGEGWVGSDRREAYPVLRRLGEAPVMECDRSALPFFGFRGIGVHLNGFVPTPQGPLIWVARRARDRRQSPGKLDHLVAGGQPAGLTLEENLAKECREEADIPLELARRAVRVGEFSYRRDVRRGLRDDTLVVYDLEVPADFRPRNLDGEVEEFFLRRPEDLLPLLRDTDEFKYNVAPIVIGFLLRRGLIPAGEPGIEEVREALEEGPGETPKDRTAAPRT
jgi:8-oxo-dGTP pyrophosphatase MutT (NUDIX family)